MIVLINLIVYSLIACDFCNSTFSTYNGWSTSPYVMGSLTSTCGTYHLFGGYGIFPALTIVSKTFTGLVPHHHLNISISVLMMDYTQNGMDFVIDGNSRTFSKTTITTNWDYCG